MRPIGLAVVFGTAPISWTGSLRGLPPLPFERHRAEMAERGVAALRIVEERDVIEHGAACGGSGGPRRVVIELDLQRREEAFGHRVVPQQPTPLMLRSTPCPARIPRYSALAYCEPRSE